MLSENHRTEFKLNLTDQLEKEVVGFLNSREGGDIFIGIEAVINLFWLRTRNLAIAHSLKLRSMF